jgi:hypothetical protein
VKAPRTGRAGRHASNPLLRRVGQLGRWGAGLAATLRSGRACAETAFSGAPAGLRAPGPQGCAGRRGSAGQGKRRGLQGMGEGKMAGRVTCITKENPCHLNRSEAPRGGDAFPSLRETNTYGGGHYRKKPATVWGSRHFVRFSGGRNRSRAGAGCRSAHSKYRRPHQFEVFGLQRLLDKR